MPTNADVLSLQQEKVRKKLPVLFEMSTFLFGEMKKNAEVEKISTRDFRIPVNVSYGGDYRTFDPDGGDMGRGSGPKITHFVSSYFPIIFAIELSNLQMYATATSEQAVKNAYALALAKAMQSLQRDEDCSLHSPGNGVIATATATNSTDTYTCDTDFSVQLLRRQMKVKVVDTAITGYRETNASYSGTKIYSYRVTAINVPSGTVQLDGAVYSPVATDKLVFDGAADPSSNAIAWKRSIPTWLSTATTGSLQSVDRAVYPEIISNWINAGSQKLQGLHGMLLLDLIEQRNDDVGNLTAVFHPKQRTAWYEALTAISEWSRGKSDQPIDIVPKRSREFMFAGMRAVADKHQNRTRVDFLNFNTFGRAVLKDLDWYQVGSNKVFPLRGTSGGLAAGILMYLEMHSDWYCDNPAANGFIYGLAIPSTT